MPALFPKWATVALRTALVLLVLIPASLIGGLMIYVRTPYNTEENRAPDQPVEFDHRHHARDDGIRCLYCHHEAERTPYAGVPSSDLCMGCHNQVWSESPLLDPVRRSYFSQTPIRWERVHDLADFVYFDHSVHVRNGVDCVHCHGEVDQMARVAKVEPLQMQWCLDCHRDPKGTLARYPKETELDRTGIQTELDPTLETGRGISRLTTCTACHR